MSAQRIQLQPVAHQSIETLETLAHIGGPRRQIDPGSRSHAKHAQPRSSTPSNCISVGLSNPHPTSIRRPPPSVIVKPLGVPLAIVAPETSTLTQRLPPAASPCAWFCRFR